MDDDGGARVDDEGWGGAPELARGAGYDWGDERRAARALSDGMLLAAMANENPWAWDEFVARFAAVFAAYARRADVAREQWRISVLETLTDEGLRLTSPGVARPRQLGVYLLRAAINRYHEARRTERLRERLQASVADLDAVERIVRSACSAYALAASAGPLVAGSIGATGEGDEDGGALSNLARRLAEGMTPEERAHVAWLAEGIPQRVIAAWLGIGYEAAAKRGTRLCARLRARAVAMIDASPPSERTAIRRGFRIGPDRPPAPEGTHGSGTAREER